MKPQHRLLGVLGCVILLGCAAQAQTTLYWDTNNFNPGSGDTGGTWQTGAGNWNASPDGSGMDVNFTDGDWAVFAAGADGLAAKTITISGTVATPSILLEETGLVTLSGGSIDITGGSVFDTSVLGTATGQALVWNPVLVGTGALTVRAHGNLTDSGGSSTSDLALTGANTFTGDVTVLTGLLNLNSGLGAASNRIVLDGGGLVDKNQSLTSAREIVIGAAGGILRTGGTATTTLNGTISNAAGVTTTVIRHTEGGTLRLGGSGAGFAGTLTNARGELQITGTGADWSGTAFVLDTNGGNLVFNGGGTARAASVSAVGDNTNIDGGTTLDLPVYTITPTVTSGLAANLGTSLASDGYVTSSTGTLVVNNGIAASGTLETNGHIVYAVVRDPSPGVPLTLVKNYCNDLKLSRANTYTGGTIINAGRVSADQNGAGFGTGKVTVNSGGQAYLQLAGGTYANDFDLTGNGVQETGTPVIERGALRLGTVTTTGTITIQSAGARIVATSGLWGKLAGPLAGSGALEINSNTSNATSTGIVSLTGSGSGYTGTLTVSQGRFNFSNTLGGSLVVAPTVNATTLGAGTSIAGNLTLNSATKTVTFANSNGTLAVGGGITLSGVTSVSLAKPAPGTTSVTLMTYGGSLTGTAANFVLENAASYRGTPVFDVATPGQIKLTGLQGLNLTWSGGTTAWNIETTANWNSGATTFSFGDAVTFTDAGTNKSVVMSTTLEPSSVTVNNSTGNDYTFTASPTTAGLAGSMSLTKSGTGTLTLGGTNSYTGPITVSGGRLKMGTAAAFGQSSGITILSGGQVDINGQSPGNSNFFTNGYTYTIAGNGNDGSGAIVNTGASVDSKAAVKFLVLSNNASIGATNRFDVGFDTKAGMGSINGAGYVLTKKGAGDIYFRGPAGNFSLAVEAGRAVISDTDLAFGGAAGAVSVSAGAQVATYGSRTVATPLTMAASATLSNAGTGTGIWTGQVTAAGAFSVDSTGGDIILRGGISGSGTLTKAGTNYLVLDGASNPFTGKIVISGGELRAPNDAALGAAPASLVADAITLNGGSLRGGTASGPLASATLGSPTRGITVSTGYAWTPGTGYSLTLDSPVVTPGSMASAAGTMVYNQPLTGPGIFTVTGTATVNGGVNYTGASEVVVQNGGSLTFSGSGTSTMSQLRVMTATLGFAGGAVVNVGRFVSCDSSAAVSLVNHTGGTLNITGTDNTNTTSASFLVGHWSGAAVATHNLSGGTINSPATLLSLGWDAPTVNFNQTGGTFNLYGLNLNNSRSNAAAYNLTGGRLNLGAGAITVNAAKSVNLGGGTLGALADWTTSQTLNLTGTGGDVTINTLDPVDNTTARTISITGTLAGSGGFIKAGAGTLSIESTTNTFTGYATALGGTLRLSGNISTADARVQTGGTLAPGTNAAVGTGTLGSLLMEGGTLSFRLSSTGGDKLVSTDPSGFTVTNASVIQGLPMGVLAVNDVIPLVDFDGTIGGLGLGGLTLQMANPHFVGELVENTTDTRLDLKITSVETLLWQGSVNNTWDTNTTANWKTSISGTASNFYEYDAVKFSDFGAGVPNVALSGTIKPSQVEFDSTAHYTLSGAAISGAGGLLKKNSGTLTLSNENTYTGPTTLNAGTLEIGNGGTTGSLGATAVTDNATLTFNRSDAATFAGVISGSGQVVKRGGGGLTLSGANTFTGATLVQEGTLFVGNGAATGTSAGGITVSAGAALDLFGATIPLGEAVTIAGVGPAGYALTGTGTTQGTLVLSANATIGGAARFNLGTGPGPVTITGGRTLTKSGTGAVWYRGPENGVGNALAALVIDGGTFGVETGNNALNAVPVTVKPGGVLSAWGNNGGVSPTTQNNPVTLDGGALGSDMAGQTWTGAVTLTANSFLGGGSVGDYTLTGAIGQSGGSFGVTKIATGTVTLSGTNTYTGSTTVNEGTLILAASGGLRFAPGANGVCNKITGLGTATLNGTFTLDLGGAALANGNSWTLVDVTTKTYGTTFALGGFTEASDVHTKVDGANTWTFTEATGVLSLATTSSGFDSWIAGFPTLPVGQRGPAADYDADGYSNLLEYVLGGDPTLGDAAAIGPAVARAGSNLVVTFKRSDLSEADTTLVLQYGSTLAGWTDVPIGPSPGSGIVSITENTPTAELDTVTVTIPSPGPYLFVRLRATKP